MAITNELIKKLCPGVTLWQIDECRFDLLKFIAAAHSIVQARQVLRIAIHGNAIVNEYGGDVTGN